MMILRHWRGIAKAQEAEHYIHHLKTETFPRLAKIDGFIRASILRRTAPQGIEFLIITFWESLQAIQDFAGETATVAVVPAEVQAMMVEYDREVSHYEVTADYLPEPRDL
jgi:heme-degrading monooxygenase HmoA